MTVALKVSRSLFLSISFLESNHILFIFWAMTSLLSSPLRLLLIGDIRRSLSCLAVGLTLGFLAKGSLLSFDSSPSTLLGLAIKLSKLAFISSSLSEC